MKFLLTICFIATFGVVASERSIVLGSTFGNTHVMDTKWVTLPRKRWQRHIEKEAVTLSGEKPITGIVITDNLSGKGADYQVIQGGLGHSSVTIKLTETGYGINTIIHILGKD